MAERFFTEDFIHRLERLALVTRRAAAGPLQGERRSSQRGQSVEFADYRPYVPGDDFRRIDWSAYARLERFFIKLFVEEQDLLVHFLIDTSRSMRWGQPAKLEYAARSAGALGYVALAGLDRVTITALGASSRPRSGRSSYFPPHRGKNQALALFNFLQALYDPPQPENGSENGSFAPTRALRAYAAGALQPGPLMLLSDLMDDGWLDGLRALASRGFEVTLVHILAPEEVQPALQGDFKLLDSEGGAEVEITADYELLERYRQNLKDWQADLRRFSNARGMHYVPLDTTLPIEELLFAWLRQKGVLK